MSFYSKVLEGIDNDNISFSNINGSYTAGELKGNVAKYEEMLGFKNLEGYRVALLIDSIECYLPLFLAVNKLKGTVVPLSLQFRHDDLHRVLDSLDPHIIFTINENSGFSFSTTMKNWAEGRETKTTIYTSEDYVEWEEHTFGSSIKVVSNLSGGFISFTSGSTGQPKGIVFSDSAVDHIFNCYAESYGLKATDSVFVYSATSTVYGLLAMNTVLRGGAKLVTADGFDLIKIIDTMEKTKCNKITTTPSIFKTIYNFASKLKPEVLKGLELVCVIGEKVTPSFVGNFPLMENCLFLSYYGSSEAGPIADGLINEDAEEIELSLVKGAEPKIMDDELWIKTGGMFTEYYNSPSLTQEAFEDGWFKTGDLVEFTSDRTFKIIGRKKDVIKKGGMQVVSSEVENFLSSIDGVKNVAVAGAPHEIYGEQVVAFVVAEGVTAKDIRSYCTGRISAYKIPDKVVFVDELPLTHGKVDKVKLKSLV
ncbi:class I adenylate-forming enzyme family protein [Neobacillus sp. 114]|uniref:class I adenylate-forming enzyme family protein n=1 Tax=Neobacillus sp. 114 TaxID=3048535 RepID=UPI0024C2523B|nr:class I adenylate-forming enzyme family protein [Neobacillus sp. 114]